MILLYFESGFRVAACLLTRLSVVSALSGYGPGNVRALLLGCCAWLPCGGGAACKQVACGLPLQPLVVEVGRLLGWVLLGKASFVSAATGDFLDRLQDWWCTNVHGSRVC